MLFSEDVVQYRMYDRFGCSDITTNCKFFIFQYLLTYIDTGLHCVKIVCSLHTIGCFGPDVSNMWVILISILYFRINPIEI